jgi:hypothetical protein
MDIPFLRRAAELCGFGAAKISSGIYDRKAQNAV